MIFNISRFILPFFFPLILLGCITPSYKNSITMSDVGDNVKERKAGAEYFFKEPNFNFNKQRPIAVALPEVRLTQGALSRGESHYYSKYFQESLIKMLTKSGFLSVSAANHSNIPEIVLEAYITKLEVGSDIDRQKHGLIGPFLFSPTVEVEGAFYEKQSGKRRKVAAFFEHGGKSGGSFINNLSGQELVVGSLDQMVDRLKKLIEENTK